MSKTSREKKKKLKDLQEFLIVLKVKGEAVHQKMVVKAKDMATAIRVAETKRPNARVVNVTRL